MEYKSRTGKISLKLERVLWIDLIALPLHAMFMSSAPDLKKLQTLNFGEKKYMKWEEVERVMLKT